MMCTPLDFTGPRLSDSRYVNTAAAQRGTVVPRWAAGAFAIALAGVLAAAPARAHAQGATANAATVPPDSPPPSGEVTAPGVAAANAATTPGAAIPAVASVRSAPAEPSADTSAASDAAALLPAPTGGGANPKAAADKAGNGSGDTPFSTFGSTQKGPVNIQSDGLDLDYKNNWVLFHGHVHAVQNGGELTSNTLRVKYGKDFSEVQQMIADGNVRITQGTRWATGDHAVLEQSVHTVTLTGNPVVHDGNDRVVGQKIVVNLITGKSEVTGGAHAWFFPRDSKSPNNNSTADSKAD
ncbi:MAG: LptA/OstA family protein [Candidatus Binataceae bacterium]